jgi:hypothetical protein
MKAAGGECVRERKSLATCFEAKRGPLQGSDAVPQQYHTLFAVGDYNVDEANSLEFGVGYGFTSSSEDVILKLILNHDF